MKRLPLVICLIVLTGFLSGCRPKGILHSWEMRALLVDLHKTDAMIQLAGLQHGHEEDKNIYYALVLERHGVTQAQFDSSLVWYTAHPQLFDKIYPKVIAQLNEEKAAFELAHAEELNLNPNANGIKLAVSETKDSKPLSEPLSPEQLDSVLWVMRNSYPSIWMPYPGR